MPLNRSPSEALRPPRPSAPFPATSSARAYTVLDTTQLVNAVWLSLVRQAAPERVHLDFRSSRGKHH